MGDPIKGLFDQLAKGVEKAPGWGYLLVIVLLWANLVGLPTKIDIPVWMKFPLSYELIVIVATFLFYKFGDKIDDIVFKQKDGETREFFKKRYMTESDNAQTALGVGEEGLYSLATNLAAAAEKEQGKVWVYWSNEIAKVTRSLFAPLLLLGGFYLAIREPFAGILLIVLAVLMFFLYPWLKVLHIRGLYKLAAKLKENVKKYDMKEMNKLNLYFWDAKFITVARSAGPAIDKA